MSARPCVVHVTTTDISLVVLLGPQLQAFQDAGYDVIGVSAPGPYVERLADLGVRHISLRHATRAVAPVHDVAALVELRKLFATLEPDIVHTHNPKPGVYGRIAARLAKVPAVVNTIHGLYAQPTDSWARRTVVYGLERVAARCSDAELVQNVEDIPVLRSLGIPDEKLHLLGNGIDLAHFDPERVSPEARTELRRAWGVEPGAVVCGVVGRLVWEKGYREVFEAARMLRERNPSLRFVVVGPTDDAKGNALTVDDMAAARALGNVHFAGEHDDMTGCYGAFDLYALASHREGFPRSAMEAAAMQLPVVATNIRGCRQVVADGETGRLVRVRDASELASAIGELASDSEARTRMGSAAREKAIAEFDQRRCIDLTLRVYEELLGRDAMTGAAA